MAPHGPTKALEAKVATLVGGERRVGKMWAVQQAHVAPTTAQRLGECAAAEDHKVGIAAKANHGCGAQLG